MSAQVALVTGAASGIGEAIAEDLAAQGFRVVVADRDEERGAEVAARVGGRFVPVDVSRRADNERAVASVVEAHGRLDVVVLNAGVPGGCGIDDFTEEAYRATMGANLDGVVFGFHAALPHLRAAGGGSVVVTSSMAGLTASPDPFYAAGKHAVIGLVRSASMLLAADGIRINALCPGLVDTPLVAPFRSALVDAGLALAAPADAATAVRSILTSGRSGEAWVFQHGQEAVPVPDPELPLAQADPG